MRECLECKKTFVPTRCQKKCCSKSCSLAFRKRDARRRAKEWHKNNGDYARSRYQKKPPVFAACKNCGKEFRKKTAGLYCSISCRGKFRRKNNPEWYKAAYQRDKERSNAVSMKRYHATRKKTPWKPLMEMARFRAKKKGIPFNLTDPWAVAKWNGKCEITGIAFELGKSIRGCFSPSLDQIKHSQGYTQDNCRFILWAINSMKGSGTDFDILKIAKAMANTSRTEK